jgi:molecular chaperone HscB
MSNYFQIFDIQQQYFVDKDLLEAKYLQLQSQFHPDKAIGKSEEDKMSALKQSADLNEAYKILNSDVPRAEYMLGLEGIRVNKEKENTYQPSQNLLIMQMELREELEASDFDAEKFKSEVKNKIETVKKEFSNYFDAKDYEQAAQKAMELRYLDKLRTEIK